MRFEFSLNLCLGALKMLTILGVIRFTDGEGTKELVFVLAES